MTNKRVKGSPKLTIRSRRTAATTSATTSAKESATPTETTTTTTSASKSAIATATKSKSSGPKRSSKSATATATTTTTSASKSAEDETPQEKESMIAGILKLLKDNGITNRIMNKNFVDQIDKMKTMTDEIKSMKESYLKLQQQVDKQESATTTTTSMSKSAMATATGSKSAEDKNPQMNSLMASFADILDVVREMRGLILGLSDRIGKVEAKLEGEYIAEELMEVDYAMRSLENDIEEIKINVDKAESSVIFKELAWHEERSKELILFKIDESDSKSWNETKTYERTELTKTINKVCAFNESEVVFIRRVGVKTPNKVRPIVVGLKSTSRRDEIVARGRGARIGIDENLTPTQLENKRRVKDEVKLKNECEDGRLYKLVGSAGNYKSIRVRKID
jgi:hypothetical protein